MEYTIAWNYSNNISQFNHEPKLARYTTIKFTQWLSFFWYPRIKEHICIFERPWMQHCTLSCFPQFFFKCYRLAPVVSLLLKSAGQISLPFSHFGCGWLFWTCDFCVHVNSFRPTFVSFQKCGSKHIHVCMQSHVLIVFVMLCQWGASALSLAMV